MTPLNPPAEAEGNRAGYTHRVAAGAYVFHNGRVLLLKRAKPPFTLAPPGGRLHENEDPIVGVCREVREETGLDVDVLGVADTWFGSVDGVQPVLLCIDYLAVSGGDQVHLNEEHTGFVWATRAEIEDGQVMTLDARGHGYRPEHILNAFELLERLVGDAQDHRKSERA